MLSVTEICQSMKSFSKKTIPNSQNRYNVNYSLAVNSHFFRSKGNSNITFRLPKFKFKTTWIRRTAYHYRQQQQQQQQQQ